MNGSIIVIRLVNLFLIFVEGFLLLRFALKLLAANSATPFVSWIYATTLPLLEPFRGAFPSPLLEQGHILEFSTLFAIVIYAIIGWLLTELVEFIAETENRRRYRQPQ